MSSKFLVIPTNMMHIWRTKILSLCGKNTGQAVMNNHQLQNLTICGSPHLKIIYIMIKVK